MSSSDKDFSPWIQTPKRYHQLAEKMGWALTIFIVGTLILPWIQTVQGLGKVVAFSPDDREQRIVAPIEGRVKKWYVNEGSRVKKGDPIVEMTDNDPEILNRLKLERDATQKKVDAAKLGIETSKKNLERQRELFEQGLSSKRTFELANLELVKYLTDEANAISDLAKIDVRLARQTAQMLSAPVDGMILKRRTGFENELLKTGDLLSVLIPESASRSVELYVQGNDMPLIQAGHEVRLQFEGWPAIQFSGWPSVAIGTFPGKVAFVDPMDDGHGNYRVMIVPIPGEPWPSENYLRQGVRVLGWISIQKVRLGFELWRRFNAFPIVPPAESLLQETSKK